MASVSFVIPVYNKARYLKFVLNSLANQNGEFDREFIFINDGSTDGSLEILRSYTKNWKNSRIICQSNKGSAHATNVGISHAKKEYIKFLDADDILFSNTTITLLCFLEKYKEIVLAYGLQRKTEDISKVSLKKKINLNFEIISKPLDLAMRNSMFNPSQFLVKTDLCKDVGGCDERIKFSQEYSLTLKLALKGKFLKLNDFVTVLPIIAPGQISENKIEQIYRVSKALELFLKDNNNLSKKILAKAQRRLTGRAWRFAKRNLGASYFSKWFLFYLKGILGVNTNSIKIIEEANKVYKQLHFK